MIGIYKITNQLNGKVYVGQSVDIHRRWNQHKQEGKKLIHKYPLYLAMNKYGIENFTFKVIEECSQQELDTREQYWIKELKSLVTENGYNISIGGSNRLHCYAEEIYDLWDKGYSLGSLAEILPVGKLQFKII